MKINIMFDYNCETKFSECELENGAISEIINYSKKWFYEEFNKEAPKIEVYILKYHEFLLCDKDEDIKQYINEEHIIKIKFLVPLTDDIILSYMRRKEYL